jgi:hypothetical protein
MNSKVVVVAGLVIVVSVVSVIGLGVFRYVGPQLGAEEEAPHELSESEEAAETDPAGNALGDEFSSGKRTHRRSRTDAESGAPRSEAARRDAANSTGGAVEPEAPSNRLREELGPDRENSRDSKKRRGPGESEKDDPLRLLPFGFAGESKEAQTSESTEPTEPDAEGPTEEELAEKDLNLDEEIDYGEELKAERLRMRAKNYPRRNDDGDSAYPIEPENSSFPEASFRNVDGNGDGLLDEDEVYYHFIESQKIFIRLDTDNNNYISRNEFGLSPEVFDQHDINQNGRLSEGEIRGAHAARDVSL